MWLAVGLLMWYSNLLLGLRRDSSLCGTFDTRVKNDSNQILVYLLKWVMLLIDRVNSFCYKLKLYYIVKDALSHDEGSTTNYQYLMLSNVTHLSHSLTWDLIIILGRSLVGKARFLSGRLYHACVSFSHLSPRCPGESDFQLICCF